MTSTLSRLIATLRRLDQEASAGLLPCPFCHGTNLFLRRTNRRVIPYCLACHDCDCEGPHEETEDEARKAWNTRANLAPNLAEMLETAERALAYPLEPFDPKDPSCQKCTAVLRQERDEWVAPVLCDDCAQEVVYAAAAALAERLAGPGAAADAT